jgi:signal transduction histidine kinase
MSSTNNIAHKPPVRTVRTFSLTRRIITGVVFCQLLLAVGLTLVAVLFARQELSGAFDTALEGNAMSTLALVRYTEATPPTLLFDASLRPPAPDQKHKDLYEIIDADGKLVTRSSDWAEVPAVLLNTRTRYTDFEQGTVPYRAVVMRNVPILDSEEDEPGEDEGPPAKVTVIFASALVANQERLMALAAYVGGTSLFLLLIANGFAARSVRRGLNPLHELASQAGAISVHNWKFRPSPGVKLANELSPLVAAIETVLSRLQESFRQQRDFTDDAAHELKTSVAILKSTLQSLIHRPRTQVQYQEGLERALQDCARLEDLLARMLRLARIERLNENGTRTKIPTTELTSTCEAAISRIRSLADARNVRLDFESPVAVSVRADPEDLELIWMNLLENAVHYSPAGSAVKIRVSPNGGKTAEVSVVDGGPGIPATELPHIFERFRRGDPSRSRATGGFGLGLAICKALVDAYGGKIEATNLPDRGMQMRVQLPTDWN